MHGLQPVPSLNVTHLAPEDALGVKALVNAQTPEASYAAYYYAMLSLFAPASSVVVRDQSEETLGALIALPDETFSQLLVSHIAVSPTLSAMKQADVQESLVGNAFRNAAMQGLSSVSLTLDTPHDHSLVRLVQEEAASAKLFSKIGFCDAANKDPQAKEAPAGLDTAKIIYRHPTVADAAPIWHLVKKINKESGGLDVYALSNYVRLCRDMTNTCMVAEIDGHVVGFATAYRMPDRDRKGLFLWQTGVHPAYHGKGIGSVLETRIIDEHKPDYLNFTVEASNIAANRTAEKKAQHMRVDFAKPGSISSDALGGGHEAEVIYYVGPKTAQMMPQGL